METILTLRRRVYPARARGGAGWGACEDEEARSKRTLPRSEKLRETHLCSDGFSRDSGLKGAGEKVNGMQCKRNRPGGTEEGGREGRKEGCCESTGGLTGNLSCKKR